jgi:hypothetical protein
MRTTCILVAAMLVGDCRADDEFPTIVEVVHQLTAAHAMLLQLPGGWLMDYRLTVKEASGSEHFSFPQGLIGKCAVLWPVLRSRVEGKMRVLVEKQPKLLPTIREGNFNFETGLSLAFDGEHVGQIANYRHPFSSNYAYPLRLQCYQEAEQWFGPSARSDDEFSLPAALETYQAEYVIEGWEEVAGVSCIRLSRPGLDRMWLAVSHSCTLMMREFNYRIGGPLRDRYSSERLTELSPGVWFPLLQRHETYGKDGQILIERVLEIVETRVGDLSSKDTDVVFSATLERVEDLIDRVVYQRPAAQSEAAILDESVLHALKEVPLGMWAFVNRSALLEVVLWLNLAILLGIALAWWAFRRRPL